MKYKKIMLAGIVSLAATAFAMPTPEQTKKVESLVADLMRDDQAALKSGKKTRAEVAESAMALAGQAESEAAKLLLIKGAYNLYVKAGEFDKAIETLQSLQKAIPDMPPANIASIIGSSLRFVPRKNGGQLYRLLDETKTRVRYANETVSLEKAVKKTPADRTLRQRLAEHYAYLGKWDLALENFAAAGGTVGTIAKSEREDKAVTEKIANFWWDYPTGKAEELVTCFHAHAAMLYKEAIAAGKITGLNKVQAERRIREVGECDIPTLGHGVDRNVPPPKQGLGGKDLYMVVDLAKTGKAAISYLGEVPKNGWSDEYKMNKIVLRRIEPGSFEYTPGKSFKITKPFYIGVFEVTQKQYELTMMTNPSRWTGEMLPVDQVNYYAIRGAGKGNNWPKNNQVDDSSYLGKMRSRFGLEFDLPTEVQWEYACRAGTTGDFNVEGVDPAKFGKFKIDENDNQAASVKVGSFLPNAWGLYDMHGNVMEWCLDRTSTTTNKLGYTSFSWSTDKKDTDTDPKGPLEGDWFIRRGGSSVKNARECRSSWRSATAPDWHAFTVGFRLACPAATAK